MDAAMGHRRCSGDSCVAGTDPGPDLRRTDRAGSFAGRVVLCAAVASCLAGGCRRAEREAEPGAAAAARGDALARWLAANRPRCRAALHRARAWADRLEVDPDELDRNRIPGKRKLAEIVTTYVHLHEVAAPAERAPLMARLRQLAASTERPGFHDMADLDERTFKRDATSYLRIAVLLDRVGLVPPRYRDEIRRVHPRLDEHMPRRGIHQQMTFRNYYRRLGLAEPHALDQAASAGLIARRTGPDQIDESQAYALAHEVFALCEREELPARARFTPAQAAYLRTTLERLLVRHLAAGQTDLVGELVIGMACAGAADLTAFRDGLDHLLRVQNPDGSWGRYEDSRAMYGRFLPQALYLHTTEIAVWALATVCGRGP